MAAIHRLHRTNASHYLDFSLHYFHEDLSVRQTHIWEGAFHMMMMMMMAVRAAACQMGWRSSQVRESRR